MNIFYDEMVRERSLVDDLDKSLLPGMEPNGAEVLIADFHL